MSKIKLLSSFHLATLFAKQRCTLGLFVSIARRHELGLWLNQDPIWIKWQCYWDLWWS